MSRATVFSALKKIKLLLLVVLLAGCALEKKSGFNRTMQNLTAHYNILFNANDLLRQKQDNYAAAYTDNYNQLLNVYQDIGASAGKTDKELDAVILKANTIINVKEQSHYIGDAYLVLGKANHLYGNYFNSVEFFNYTVRSFPKRADLKQEARVWQARSLMYLRKFKEARLVLDSAFRNINPKKSITADVYGAALQYDIDTQNYPDAEDMAKKAIAANPVKTQRLRLTYILAQLQELNHETKDALYNYTRIVQSNAAFIMAFNADLNRVRIDEERQGGPKLSRMDRLRKMLKNDNNKEFIDQIYYQIALLYLEANDVDNAIKNLKLSIKNSLKNQNQKGLSYLLLADINFKYKADFVNAKKYYDSTLLNLSTDYPDYQLIQKKSNNLQVLASRLLIIGHEDTLQMLAKLSEADRAAKIEELVKEHIQLQKAAAANAAAVSPNAFGTDAKTAAQSKSNSGPSTFYFDNLSAVSQGFSDFKRVWGDRKLEDNWRRAKHTGGDLTTAIKPVPGNDVTNNQLQNNQSTTLGNSYKQDLLKNIPLSPFQLDQSNTRVYNAYLDIANFYRDILEDKKEAIANYEILIDRFPNDPNKAAIYYNLYRLYADLPDQAKSDYYKDLILKKYPQSIYAKVINDPDYNRRLDDKDAEFNSFYNQVYDLFEHRQYAEVITRADALLKQYPDNKLSAQLAYLRAIAAGHQEKLEPFKEDLVNLVAAYPNDRLIIPLVNTHLDFITANNEALAARAVVLVDSDPDEPPFAQPPPVMAQQKPQTGQKPIIAAPVTKPQTLAAAAKVNPPAAVVTVPANPPPAAVNNSAPAINTPAKQAVTQTPKPTEAPSIFSMRDSTRYYFVINVATGSTNLSSSRFGIGQFNRTNFQGGLIRHELKDAGPDNQLIVVGRFSSIYTVKDYARAIIPLMPQIMKVPADKYSFFIITQENLDKLADKKTLALYIDFYQKNY